jgi:predicted GIY-YIG superfamily endonuclease
MVYLLHFTESYRHAKHYTGYARDERALERRLRHHRNGSGARLMQVVTEAGIGFTVARTWPDGDRDKERRLKRSGGASRYCPVCRATH